MWSYITERSPKFYAYCLIAIASTVVLTVEVITNESIEWANCYPPRSASTKSSNENVTLRIVGGEYAEPGDYPYLVSLQVRYQHFCGGALISSWHVLTAGHCALDTHKDSIVAFVGSNNLDNIDFSNYYRVKEMFIHPKYTKDLRITNDIAVLLLAKEVAMSADVSIIKLPEPGRTYLYHGQKLDVSGFGTTGIDKTASRYLKRLTTYACSIEICEKFFGDQRSHGMFCAVLGRGHGVCAGDSGSPITIDRQIVIGVVSYGVLACATGLPDGYTYVQAALEFINEKMKKIPEPDE